MPILIIQMKKRTRMKRYVEPSIGVINYERCTINAQRDIAAFFIILTFPFYYCCYQYL